MQRIFNMIAETLPEEAGAASTGAESLLDAIGGILCIAGLVLFAIWLLRYRGFATLRQVPTRRYRLWFVFWPIAMLLLWQFSLSVIYAVAVKQTESLPAVANYLILIGVETAMVIMMLIVAHKAFARGLKGFGLNIRTVHKDVGFAGVYLLALFPLILLTIEAVTAVGDFIRDDFQMQQHQTLTQLTENGNPVATVLIVVATAFIVPIFEEILFRGFMQSALRSAVGPWVAILVTAGFFAVVHWPNYTHMPSLFILACGFGYAYERSGSLLRPILMHIFFNGFSVGVTLLLPA